MLDLERLIRLVTATHRWGLHPFKVAVALLLPVFILWMADRRIRHLWSAAADHEQVRGDAEPLPSRVGG
ncbi:MAG TPA: hypothetical protein VGP25_12595 [Gemmatimonadaceae bacterium]|nr:hypothetical protein [Gemmatimonadaceae bacterium]